MDRPLQPACSDPRPSRSSERSCTPPRPNERRASGSWREQIFQCSLCTRMQWMLLDLSVVLILACLLSNHQCFGVKGVSMYASPVSNTSGTSNAADDSFYQCWRLQDCEPCLRSTHSCSWCSVSTTCVPNKARIPLLAPIFREDICPLAWRERLELRSKPFGCRVSTFTFLTGAISVVSTLAGVFLIWILIRVVKWIRARWAARQEGWWKFWRVRPRWPARLRWTTKAKTNEAPQPYDCNTQNDETRPLLG